MPNAGLPELFIAVRDADPSRALSTMTRRLFSANVALGRAMAAYLTATSTPSPAEGNHWAVFRDALDVFALLIIDLGLTPLPPGDTAMDAEVLARCVRIDGVPDIEDCLFTIQRRFGWLSQAYHEGRSATPDQQMAVWSRLQTRVTDLLGPALSLLSHPFPGQPDHLFAATPQCITQKLALTTCYE
jgi:hypothetical protein